MGKSRQKSMSCEVVNNFSTSDFKKIKGTGQALHLPGELPLMSFPLPIVCGVMDGSCVCVE